MFHQIQKPQQQLDEIYFSDNFQQKLIHNKRLFIEGKGKGKWEEGLASDSESIVRILRGWVCNWWLVLTLCRSRLTGARRTHRPRTTSRSSRRRLLRLRRTVPESLLRRRPPLLDRMSRTWSSVTKVRASAATGAGSGRGAPAGPGRRRTGTAVSRAVPGAASRPGRPGTTRRWRG